MTHRFCANCGVKLMLDANFCAECGEQVAGVRPPSRRSSLRFDRYAPVLVVLAVVVIGGAAVVSGLLSEKPRPSLPGRDSPQAVAGAGQELPEGHPPIEIPEQVRQAIRDMGEKAASTPDDLGLWRHLAEVQYRAAQFDPAYLSQAAASYRHLLERTPDDLDAIRNLGNIAFDQNQPDVAIKYYEQYLEQRPDDLSVQTDLGTMYLSSGDTTRAISMYESVLQQDPKFFQAQFNLAIAYRSMGDEQKALAALEKAETLATDERMRLQVSQLLARLKGLPPPAALGAAAPAVEAPAATKPVSFQTDAEGVFRDTPILGPKVQRIEWTGTESARVYVRDFPMEKMDDGMRAMFLDRMRGRIKEKKDAHQVTQAARFEMIDEPSGTVMETISE